MVILGAIIGISIAVLTSFHLKDRKTSTRMMSARSLNGPLGHSIDSLVKSDLFIFFFMEKTHSEVAVKVSLGDDLRRFVIPSSALSLAALHDTLARLFPHFKDNTLLIKYADDEGDLVTVRCHCHDSCWVT